MANLQLIELLNIMEEKIKTLLDTQNSLYSKIDELEKKIIDLESRHVDDKKTIEKAYLDIEFLTLSHRLAADPDTIIEARRKISRLIRTIDNCIQLIEEE